jgi:hypothetical protein
MKYSKRAQLVINKNPSNILPRSGGRYIALQPARGRSPYTVNFEPQATVTVFLYSGHHTGAHLYSEMLCKQPNIGLSYLRTDGWVVRPVR